MVQVQPYCALLQSIVFGFVVSHIQTVPQLVVKLGTLGCGGKVRIRGTESSLLGVHVAPRGGEVAGEGGYSRDLQKKWSLLNL